MLLLVSIVFSVVPRKHTQALICSYRIVVTTNLRRKLKRAYFAVLAGGLEQSLRRQVTVRSIARTPCSTTFRFPIPVNRQRQHLAPTRQMRAWLAVLASPLWFAPIVRRSGADQIPEIPIQITEDRHDAVRLHHGPADEDHAG